MRSLQSFRKELWCYRNSVRGAGKGYEAYEDNRAHPRLARCDLFDNGELLWRISMPVSALILALLLGVAAGYGSIIANPPFEAPKPAQPGLSTECRPTLK